MSVVADSSPLIVLRKIGRDELLGQLFGRISIPPEVRDELAAAKWPEAVRALAATLAATAGGRSGPEDPHLISLGIGKLLKTHYQRPLGDGRVPAVNGHFRRVSHRQLARNPILLRLVV